ncbi:MAG: protein kinase [Sandaracinaceae bacterium]
MSTIPDKIGRYEVERLLGQGAMGSVYLGRDPQLDRAVAIKTVRDLDLDEGRLEIFLERFRNEAKAAARLAHPAIVAVYDVGEDPGVGPYLVFEYVAGSSLKQVIRGRGAQSAEDVVRLGRQIGAALDLAHAADVVHRDIKPDNILIGTSGEAKLADFGIARLPDAALTKEGQFLGTPCYAAPETLNQGRYGAHSDHFSFAAVLYEVISGVRAFPGDDAISVAHAVVHDEPVPLSKAADGVQVPRDVERVVMRGLSKVPEERYGSAIQLVDALASAYIEAGVLDRDPTGVQVLPPPEPSRREGSSWAFIAVVAGLAVLGIGFVIAFLDLEADPQPVLPPSYDAGTEDAGQDGGPTTPDAGPDASADAYVPPPPVDAGEADTGVEPDAGDPFIDVFDREQAAKDEVDEAEAALAAGDVDAARRSLERARALDPGNSDLAELEAQIATASP